MEGGGRDHTRSPNGGGGILSEVQVCQHYCALGYTVGVSVLTVPQSWSVRWQPTSSGATSRSTRARLQGNALDSSSETATKRHSPHRAIPLHSPPTLSLSRRDRNGSNYNIMPAAARQSLRHRSVAPPTIRIEIRCCPRIMTRAQDLAMMGKTWAIIWSLGVGDHGDIMRAFFSMIARRLGACKRGRRANALEPRSWSSSTVPAARPDLSVVRGERL